MANKNWPVGLQPIETLSGGAPQVEYFKLKNGVSSVKYTTKIYKGQVVKWDAGGWIVANAATNPSKIVGVAAEYYAGSATTKTKLPVWRGNRHIFYVQADSTAGDILTANVLRHAPIASPTTGDDNTGLSKSVLDYSAAVTGTNTLQILGPAKEVGEDQPTVAGTKGANMKLRVKFNFGFLYQEIAGIVS